MRRLLTHRVLRSILLLLAALCLAGPGLAQEAPEAEQEAELFIDTVHVNVVNVEVYVTDREGNPVTGLTADDFEVYENGRRMALTNFFAIEDQQVVAEGGQGAPPVPGVVAAEAEAPPPRAEAEPRPIPEDQRLSLVVYVDNLNIRPHNRRRVLQDVRSFLRRELSPEDRVMLVTYERALHVRQPFTSDPERVVEALFEVDDLSGLAVHAESERRDVLRRIEDSRGAGEAMMWVETYAESVRNDLHFTIDGLREIVTSLAGLPGRKALLYVSDGLPMIAAEDIFYAVDQRFQGTGAMTQMYTFDTSRRFEELAAHANANRVSFYTIDAGGLRVSSSADAQSFQVDRAGGSAHIDSIRTRNLQSTLQLLAEQTGGEAIINTNRVADDLTRVANDFRTYYSIGYTPGHSGDGRFYRIDVKLVDGGRGWSVRHREGYRDKPAEAQMSDGVLAALNFPYYSNPLGLELSFDEGVRRDDGNHLVPVTVRIPYRSLTLVPRGDAYEAKARLFLAAMDDRGWISEVQETELPVRITEADLDQVLGEDFVYTVPILLRSGEQKIAVGIRDEIAANQSFVTRSVYLSRR